MSVSLTGAIGMIANRMQQRASDQEDNPDATVEGDEEDVTATGADDETEAEDDASEPEAEGADDDDMAAEGEEDEEPSMQAAYRRGFHAANQRAAAILGCEGAQAQPEMAAEMAFVETDMTAARAVSLLATASRSSAKPGAAAAKGPSLHARMAAHKRGLRPTRKPAAKAATLNDRMAARTAQMLQHKEGV